MSKYEFRARLKGHEVEDSEKAAFYAKLLAEYTKTGKITLPEAGTVGPGLPEAS